MTRGWKKIAAALSAGLLLVGCSRMMAQHRPDAGVGMAAAGAAEITEPPPLEPGVALVTVGRVAANGATIWWKSPWQGQSTVIYGRDSHLLPVVVERTVPTPEHTAAISDLSPGTRYYLQIETATPLGVARSAVISFRTVDAPIVQVPGYKATTRTAKR
jgi:hypothetical protein